ncbi:hypothetical protein DPMN_023279 [Dreissena polymorpha]|uniref:RING-type domain-containing protein n=1 Tax=Dreissena polymorpha TaxID=45954 RepID=A0A9D4LPC6_DREPO|nr:hypothetical protein DPMN_023279 [Dreissena polymorpha]
MASNTDKVRVNKEYLKCSIHWDTFDKPRLLPCNHSLCHDCLSNLIKTCEGSSKFRCPVCKRDVHTREKILTSNVAQLVETFPINLALLRILECSEQPDNRGGNKAELDRKHFLESLLKCKVHKTKLIDHLCETHNEVCCDECVLDDHKNCPCQHLSDIVNERQNTEDLLQLKDCINTTNSKIDKLVGFHQKRSKEHERLIQAATFELKRKRTRVEKSVTTLIGKVKTNSKLKGKELAVIFAEKQKSYNGIMKQLNRCKEHLLIAKQSKHMLLNILMKQCTARIIQKLSKDITLVENNNSKRRMIRTKCLNIETVKLSLKKQVIISESPPTNCTINVDSHPMLQPTSRLRNCLWVSDKVIVGIEMPNCLALIDVEKKIALFIYPCSSEPYSLSEKEDARVVVCFPGKDTSTLETMEVTDSEIKLDKTLTIPFTAHAACFNSDKRLYVCLSLSKNLAFLDEEGTFLSSIVLPPSTYDYLIPSVDFTMFYIVSSLNGVVTIVDVGGRNTTKYRHGDLKLPGFPAVDLEGNIYIPSCHGNCVHQVDRHGTKGRTLLINEVMRPSCVSFNMTGIRMAVTELYSCQLKVFHRSLLVQSNTSNICAMM